MTRSRSARLRPASPRHLAGVDPVSVNDDAARRGLAKHLRQAHDRHGAGIDDVGENLARTYGGELVDVADEQERRPVRQGADEGLHQQDVDHRRFVNNEEIAAKRVRLVAFEAAVLRVSLKQAMDRLRFDSGRLGQALRGAAGRGAEGDGDALRDQHLQDRIDERGLADTGTAGDDKGLARSGKA